MGKFYRLETCQNFDIISNFYETVAVSASFARLIWPGLALTGGVPYPVKAVTGHFVPHVWSKYINNKNK